MYQSLSLSRSNSENTPVNKTSSPHTSLKHIVGADQLIEDNYTSLKKQRISAVRVAISWQQAEKIPYFYNWDAVINGLENAKEHRMQPIWDLCYFGFPDNLTLLQPNFARRFAAFCRAFVRYCKYTEPDATLKISAINETSFYSNEAYLSLNQEARDILTQACVQATSAMTEEDPSICFVANHSIADIISLLGESRLCDTTLAIAS